MLKVGDYAPPFEAKSTTGRISLRDYVGKKHVMLIFYPQDDTPICTKQLCNVRDAYTEYEALDTVVLGINPADNMSHQRFADKFRYRFPLVYDEGEHLRKAYDVKKILGFIAQQRIVYIIGKDGRIAYAKKGNPSTEELHACIRTLQASDK